jgi:transposase
MAAALCYGSHGGGAAVAFHHQHGAYDTDTLIGVLGELQAFLGGQKATLVWDGLPAHRSLAVRAWLGRQRSWLLVTEPLPGYAPELNPVEGLWASLKGVELANLAADTLQEVIAAAERGVQRIRSTHWLAFAFLRPVAVVSSGRVAGNGHMPCRVVRRDGAAYLARMRPARTAAGLAGAPRPAAASPAGPRGWPSARRACRRRPGTSGSAWPRTASRSAAQRR